METLTVIGLWVYTIAALAFCTGMVVVLFVVNDLEKKERMK